MEKYANLRTSFQIFSIVFPFLLIELRHGVSVTLYILSNFCFKKLFDCKHLHNPKVYLIGDRIF
jgi:hypothetical protein